VVASDSAATDTTSGIGQPIKKISEIAGTNILWGASGDHGLVQKVRAALTEFRKPPASLRSCSQILSTLIGPVLAESAKYHVPYPAPGFENPPVFTGLFAGADAKAGPWILEVEKDNRSTCYGEQMGCFAAVGSGKLLAQAVFRPHLFTPLPERDEEWAKVIAHKVVEDAVELSSARGLGLPVQMWIIRKGKKPRALKSDDLRVLGDSCEILRAEQRDALGKVASRQAGTQQEPEIPRPQER